jgi:soluble P-type ATPase
MVREAVLGIAVLLEEGAFPKTLTDADVVCTSILSALDLLSHPQRLTATLRT